MDITAGFHAHTGPLPDIEEGQGAIAILRNGEQCLIGPRYIDPNWTTPWHQSGEADDIVAYRPLDTAIPDDIVRNVEVLLSSDMDAEAYRSQARGQLRGLLVLYKEQWPFVRSFAEVERNTDTFDEEEGF